VFKPEQTALSTEPAGHDAYPPAKTKCNAAQTWNGHICQKCGAREKAKRRRNLVPNSIRIGSLYLKLVAARLEVRVIGYTLVG
jgi:hypothetical protein